MNALKQIRDHLEAVVPTQRYFNIPVDKYEDVEVLLNELGWDFNRESIREIRNGVVTERNVRFYNYCKSTRCGFSINFTNRTYRPKLRARVPRSAIVNSLVNHKI